MNIDPCFLLLLTYMLILMHVILICINLWIFTLCAYCSDGGAGVRASSLPGPVGQRVSECWGSGEEIAPLQHPPQSPLRER